MKPTLDAFNHPDVIGIIEVILEKINGIKKSRSKFMKHLFELFMGLRGRYNFMNMSRYGSYTEQSYRNNFAREFDFMDFNTAMIKESCSPHLIIAFDPSYIPKSGKHTDHLGWFWSGASGKPLKGLEIGGLAVIDVENNTAMSLEAVQTPCSKQLKLDGKTLVDHYGDVIVQRAVTLKQLSNYLAVDGYFAKGGFIDAITSQTGLEVISKLRNDANLKYLHNGRREKRRGAPRKFDGKINIKQIDKRRIQLEYEDELVKVHSGVVWSQGLKRKVKVAYVQRWDNGRYTGHYAVLFSTDLHLSGKLIYQYYKSRFQIEFLFRDAKQHCGLNHCQARDEKKLYFHFNTSLTTVSLAKAVHYLPVEKEKRGPFSMDDIKTLYANRIMVKRIFSNLDLDLNCEKIRAIYYDALFFGRKAA